MWAALGVDTDAGLSLRLVIQSQDAAAASKLRAFVPKLYGYLGKWRDAPPCMVSLTDDVVAKALTPSVENDRLVLVIDNEKTRDIIARFVAPHLGRIRRMRLVAQSANNVRQLVLACLMYIQDYDQKKWPESFEKLMPYLDNERRVLVNPADPTRETGYVLFKPPVPVKDVVNPSQMILVYEAHETWPELGLNVGFLDGHIQRIGDEVRFMNLLEKSAQNSLR